MKLPSGEREHQAGDPHCTACDPGWPQPHAEVAEHCCPGLVHAETEWNNGRAVTPNVIYYCEMCYEDDFR